MTETTISQEVEINQENYTEATPGEKSMAKEILRLVKKSLDIVRGVLNLY